MKTLMFRWFFAVCSFVALSRPLFPADLTLSWNDRSDNEAGFAVERRAAADAPFAEIARLPANAVSFVDRNLPPNTSFTYRVRAFNSAGYSAYTNDATGTTGPNPPAAPENLRAVAVIVVTVNAP